MSHIDVPGGGGSGAPTDATYITQTANGTLSAEQALAALATGLLKSTTGTGVVSIAAQGTDYYAPSGTDVAVADGGTGASTATAGFDALSPLTTQGDILYHNGTNNVRLAAGTSGHFLKTQGAGANPLWAAASGSGFTSVAMQVLTSGTTTYTPTSGMAFCIVFCQGGGGGAPGETTTDATVSGGGGGGCAIKLYTAAQIGASEPCTVGAASSGAAGNDSTFSSAGTLITGSGGGVGVSTTGTTGGSGAMGGAGGAATGGDINIPGQPGSVSYITSTSFKFGGNGGSSFLGAGGRGGQSAVSGTAVQGENGTGAGGGGGGGKTEDTTDVNATSGAAGVIWIIEFIS